jgi:uncharacterized phage protein (TIGR02218 family)
MTYATDTVSIQVSAPVELYEFATPVTTYRYTSFDTDFTYLGNTYTALAGLVRANLATTGFNDGDRDLEVTLPASTAFVQANVFGRLPRNITLTLRILQQLSGEARMVWQGPVTAIAVEGRMAKVVVPSKVDDALEAEIPNVRFQPLCNHFLFDDRCMLNAADYDVAANVSTVASTTIVVSTVGGNPDQWFQAGELVRTLDGERRLIVSQVGTTLRINYPFRELVPGNALTLFPGCDHTIKTCRVKFSNHRNFGGHPNVIHDFVKLTRLLLGKKVS